MVNPSTEAGEVTLPRQRGLGCYCGRGGSGPQVVIDPALRRSRRAAVQVRGGERNALMPRSFKQNAHLLPEQALPRAPTTVRDQPSAGAVFGIQAQLDHRQDIAKAQSALFGSGLADLRGGKRVKTVGRVSLTVDSRSGVTEDDRSPRGSAISCPSPNSPIGSRRPRASVWHGDQVYPYAEGRTG
jgi:hypothetical protein